MVQMKVATRLPNSFISKCLSSDLISFHHPHFILLFFLSSSTFLAFQLSSFQLVSYSGHRGIQTAWHNHGNTGPLETERPAFFCVDKRLRWRLQSDSIQLDL